MTTALNPLEQLGRTYQVAAEQHQAGLRAAAEACGNDFGPPPTDLAGAAAIIGKLRADNKALKHQVDALTMRIRVDGDQKLAGYDEMRITCGAEFKPPADLAAAAAIVREIRADRDAAHARITEANQQMAGLKAGIAQQVQAIVSGGTVADESPLAPIVRVMTGLRDEILHLLALGEKFGERLKDALLDKGLGELPGLTECLPGATPMLRAAEAAAILTHHERDRLAREGYLRQRGWKFLGGGAWQRPSNHANQGSLPFDAAIRAQAAFDAEPFKGAPLKLRGLTAEMAARQRAEPKAASVAELDGSLKPIVANLTAGSGQAPVPGKSAAPALVAPALVPANAPMIFSAPPPVPGPVRDLVVLDDEGLPPVQLPPRPVPATDLRAAIVPGPRPRAQGAPAEPNESLAAAIQNLPRLAPLPTGTNQYAGQTFHE